jgi:hypothetical protein
MKTHTPKNTEIFHLSASDFLTAGEGDWRAERLAEETPDYESETARALALAEMGEHADSEQVRAAAESDREAEAEKLAGYYWWTCCPGCMPDSDASGPFETEEEANEDAGGGEYEDHIIALAEELGEDPADITEESYDCYGLTVLSCGRAEYAVGTDEEADEAWDQSLDSYLDDCGVLDSMPENLRPYFDRDAWKRDARFDGRGHSLASYDGNEMDLSDGFVAFRIN